MGKLLRVTLRKPKQGLEWRYAMAWWGDSKRTGSPEEMLLAINGPKTSFPWYKTLSYDLINKEAKHGQAAAGDAT